MNRMPRTSDTYGVPSFTAEVVMDLTRRTLLHGAAVAGGVTSVFEMPNTMPLTTTAETLADKVRRARHRMFCDFAFFVGGTRDNVEDIPKLEKLEGSAGIKVFMGSSTGALLTAVAAAVSVPSAAPVSMV